MVVETEVPEGQWWVHVARVCFPDDAVILSSQVDGTPNWSLKVYEPSAPTVELYSTTGVGSDVIVALIHDGLWTVDDEGRNFTHTLKADGTHITSTGGRAFVSEYTLNTSLWGPIVVKFVDYVRSAMSN